MPVFYLWLKSRNVYLTCMLLFVAACLTIGLDKGFTDTLHTQARPMDFWLQVVTWLGDGRVLIPACLLFSLAMLITKQPRAKLPLFALAAFLISGATTQFLKMIIGRPRPYLAGDLRYMHTPLDILQGFTLNSDFSSFPSGHATAIFSVAWFAASRVQSWLGRSALVALAAVIALTRVALWKHFLADTIAGAGIGIFVAQLVIDTMTRKPIVEGAATAALSKEDSLPSR